MIHLSSFAAVHYRGLDGLSIPRLSAANLVTGANGIGKTALLEAIWLFVGRYNPVQLWNTNIQRSAYPVLDPVTRLSHGVLELHGHENGSRHELKCTFESVPHAGAAAAVGRTADSTVGRLQTCIDGKIAEGKIDGLHQAPGGTVRFANPNAPNPRPNCIIEGTKYQQDDFDHYLKYYSEMVRDSRKEELTSTLNEILPGIRSIEILIDESRNTYLSAVTAAGEQLPVDHLGSGVVRLLRISLSMFMSRYGILLADELENGIHYSALQDVWKQIRRWMEAWNVQIVATTHSNDCIDAAIAAFEDAPHDLSIHQLFVNGTTGRVDATTFTGEALEGARDLNLEVR